MKAFILSVLVGISSSAIAADFHRAATCSAPHVFEGELIVRLSSDFTAAKVSNDDIVFYPTRVVSAGGPVLTLDFDTPRGTERIIIAVDGQHVLQVLDPDTNEFEKIADLTCRR